MPTQTTNLSLNKPLVANPVDADLWGGYLNTNADTLDGAIYAGTSLATTSPLSVTKSGFNTLYLLDATTTSITVNLGAVTTLGDGWYAHFKRIDSSTNTVTIDAAGSDLIDGNATIGLSGQYDIVSLYGDGTDEFFIEYGSVPDGSIDSNKLDSSIFATKSIMESYTSTNTVVVPSVVQYHPGAAKGWCKWGVDAVIDASHNVSSITDNGTGDWTINWNEDFGSGNYVTAGCMYISGAIGDRREFYGVPAAGSIQMKGGGTTGGVTSETGYDSISIVAFGTQA